MSLGSISSTSVSAAAPEKDHSRSLTALWVALGLVLVTAIAFSPVTRCAYVEFDDYDYVLANPPVLRGLTPDGLAWALLAGHASNWHPLTWASHMLDVSLFGQNPLGPHLVNLLLHILNTLLLFGFWRRFTGALWPSAAVAAFFALHPLHVESVAWISERKDVLSTCFGLLALWAYGLWARASESRAESSNPGTPSEARKRRRQLYGVALLCFALGLMSKPMLVSLPLVLLLLDFWPLQRFPMETWRETVLGLRERVQEKLPFFALSLASCVVTFLVQRHGGAVRELVSFPLAARLENAVVAYGRYLGKTVWPADLALLYPHPGYWPLSTVLAAVLLLAGVSWVAWCYRRRLPFVFTGWFWFLITLVPVIGLVQVGDQSIADRYMYIPSIGLFAAMAWSAAALAERTKLHRNVLAALAILGLGCCALRTRAQTTYWQTTESLYKHALTVTDNAALVRQVFGYYYYNLGNEAKAAGRMDEAISRYQRALELDPNNAMTHNNLGVAFQTGGRLDQAIQEYLAAVRLAPTNAAAHNNLAVAYSTQNRLPEACAELAEAVRLAPDDASSQNNLGALLVRQGKIEEAIPHYAEAARLAPNNPAVHDNLGDALARAGKLREAIACYRKALELNPNDPVAQNRLNNLQMQPSTNAP